MNHPVVYSCAAIVFLFFLKQRLRSQNYFKICLNEKRTFNKHRKLLMFNSSLPNITFVFIKPSLQQYFLLYCSLISYSLKFIVGDIILRLAFCLLWVSHSLTRARVYITKSESFPFIPSHILTIEKLFNGLSKSFKTQAYRKFAC